jgi:hypothetical protein
MWSASERLVENDDVPLFPLSQNNAPWLAMWFFASFNAGSISSMFVVFLSGQKNQGRERTSPTSFCGAQDPSVDFIILVSPSKRKNCRKIQSEFHASLLKK